jgi:hypothetical protein
MGNLIICMGEVRSAGKLWAGNRKVRDELEGLRPRCKDNDGMME